MTIPVEEEGWGRRRRDGEGGGMEKEEGWRRSYGKKKRAEKRSANSIK